AVRSPLERLITGLPKLFNRTDRLIGQVGLFLNAQNAAAIARILAYEDQLWSAWGQTSGKLDHLMATSKVAAGHADQAWDEVSMLVAELKADGQKLGRDADDAMRQMHQLGAHFQTTQADLDRLLAESRRPFADFASSGYPQLPGLIVELRLL